MEAIETKVSEVTSEITASPYAPIVITSPAAALVKVLLVPVIVLFAKSTEIVPVAYTASAVPQSAIRFTLLKNCRRNIYKNYTVADITLLLI